MNKAIFLTLLLIFTPAWSFGQTPQLATFQETAQLLIDQTGSNNVTASIALQSTSNQEIRIPTDLINKIHDTERVLSVIVTSEEQCVLGVIDDSCIMINLTREGIKGGIFAIQNTSRIIGDSLINDINLAFDTNAKFHSVYVHHNDGTNEALETSGVISGQGTVSAVYTMPRENSNSMYEKISAILLPKPIRDSGGFYDVAKKLSENDESRISVSIIPQNGIALLQFKVSLDYPNVASDQKNIDPLKFLKINELKRSNYFSKDFYPLNSLLKVVLLSNETQKVSSINTKLVPDIIRDGERLPEFTTDGWFFDSDKGEKIDATYLFGKKFSVSKNELLFTVGPLNGNDDVDIVPPMVSDIDSFQIVILVGIVMAAVGASIYYLKGFKTKKLDK